MTATLAPVHDDAGIEEAIAAQAREPGGGLIISPDPFNGAHRDAINAAAARHRLPLIGNIVPRAGGLMSYWSDPVDGYARAASYVDRILKGASPADLPVQQPTKYSLIINLKTAKAIGLTVPPTMLDLADELIEGSDASSLPFWRQRRRLPHAQQPERVRRVGVLISLPKVPHRHVTAFVQTLRRFGGRGSEYPDRLLLAGIQRSRPMRLNWSTFAGRDSHRRSARVAG
jgi:hypothetical protein